MTLTLWVGSLRGRWPDLTQGPRAHLRNPSVTQRQTPSRQAAENLFWRGLSFIHGGSRSTSRQNALPGWGVTPKGVRYRIRRCAHQRYRYRRRSASIRGFSADLVLLQAWGCCPHASFFVDRLCRQFLADRATRLRPTPKTPSPAHHPAPELPTSMKPVPVGPAVGAVAGARSPSCPDHLGHRDTESSS